MATLPASENEFPEMLLVEGAAPAAPAAGLVKIYAKSDGLPYSKDDAGVESPMGAGTHVADTSDAHAASAVSIVDAGTFFTGTDVEAALQELGTSSASAHIADTTDAHDASAISFTPAGSIAATDVQAAIEEVAAEAGGGGGMVGFDSERYTGGDIALTSTSQAAVSGPADLVVPASTGDLLMIGFSASPVTNTNQSMAFEFATMVGGSPNRYVGARSGTPINIPVQMWFMAVSETNGVGGEFPYVVDASDVSGGNVTLRLYARVSGNRSVNADASNPLDIWVRNVGQ